MAYEPHPDLVTPPDVTLVWRYLDFVKFVELLEHRQLWFGRADMFEDPLEGSETDGELRVRTIQGIAWMGKTFRDLSNRRRRTTFLNCWRAGSEESMAMWDLYGKGSGSVAIISLVGLLKRAVEDYHRDVFIAEVRYLDWNKSNETEDLGMCFRKSLSYRHESEIRMAISADDFTKATDVPFGLAVPVDLDVLTDEVVVGPREPSWVCQLVSDLINRYGLKMQVRQSQLLKPRLYGQ
jgi:hypothetical protein